MAEEATTATGVVPSHGEHEPRRVDGSDGVDQTMIALTWITFGLLAAVLYKVAWKPILAGLDKREADIRTALEEQQKIREQLAQIEGSRSQIIGEADAKAKAILDAARKGATDAAAVIEAKAREEAATMIATATREIHAAQEKATAVLRNESAELAISLSRKILRGNLDEDRSRKLADDLIAHV